MLYILATIFMFGFLIAIHEFGHFAAAKSFGVKVNEFAIGMGPAIWKRQGEETLYTFRALPIGGYCAMEGEDESGNDDPRAFGAVARWKQFIILVAGAAMNFLAGVILSILLMLPTQGFIVPVIDSLHPDFPNQGVSGLMAGDEIVSVDGNPIWLYQDINMYFSRSNGETMDLVVVRDGEKIVLDDFPLAPREYEDDGKTQLRYGLNFSIEEATLGDKLVNGWYTALDFARIVFISLQDLISGAVGMDEMQGPVGIVDFVSEAGASAPTVADGIYNVGYFAALIAINLAVMNLLPLPALDGGRIFFLLLNGASTLVFRRQIPAKYEGAVHLVGMMALLALMLYVTIGDISRLISG